MSTIKIERRDRVSYITMSRPDKHNAFNPELIDELREAFLEEGQEGEVRAIVLAGEGASFSAGADLEWMKGQGEASEAENIASAKHMATLFSTIEECPKPTVARVQGAALGGGSGLVCAVDIAVAGPKALFGFTEVRLGLVAAVISPFVLRRLGYANARAKLLTGERFKAEEAYRIGMVHNLSDNLDEAVGSVVEQLLLGSPQAQHASKKLLAEVWDLPRLEQVEPTARAIAAARASTDGREGLTAFLEKRGPRWSS